MKKSPFIHTEPVIPPIFAGREKEIKIISKALFRENESIVLYGNDAIGKSSLVSTVYTQLILSKKNNILPVKINAFDFIMAVENDFLSVTTHQICATIWTKLFKRKYSELLEESILNKNNSTEYKSEELTLKRIFRIVSSEKLLGSGGVQKEIGGKFYIEGKIIKSQEFNSSRKPLAPFEFLHLLDELNDIISIFGYSSFMIFCDELNHLPEKVNVEVLRNYFSVFASKNIQFVVIVVNPDKIYAEDAKKLIESFNYNLEIKVFKDKDVVEKLLSNSELVDGTKFIIENGVSEYLYDVTNGHPWWIQKICDDLYNNSYKGENLLVGLENIEQSAKKYLEEIEIYKNRISAGLPFRKHNLNF